jgi:hypothetical protein
MGTTATVMNGGTVYPLVQGSLTSRWALTALTLCNNAVMNGGTLSGMQGMFGVYQKSPIDGECYLVQGRAIALCQESLLRSDRTGDVAQPCQQQPAHSTVSRPVPALPTYGVLRREQRDGRCPRTAERSHST